MKKLLFCLLAILFTIIILQNCSAQNAYVPYRGTWIYAFKLGNAGTLPNSCIPQDAYSIEGIKGVLLALSWNAFQPTEGDNGFNYNYIDQIISQVWNANPNLYIGFMIWTGEDAPLWVKTNWPCYGESNYPNFTNPNYQIAWRNMQKKFLSHLANFGIASDRDKFLFYQSCEGTTGDLRPFSNNALLDTTCVGSDANWTSFVKSSWDSTYSYISPYVVSNQLKNFHLMINTGATDKLVSNNLDDGPDANSLSLSTSSLFYYANNSPTLKYAWRKASGAGHFYQQNYETFFKNQFNSWKGSVSPSVVLTRDEQIGEPEEKNTFPDKDSTRNLFATAASMIDFGLDMWMISSDELYDCTSGTPIPNYAKHEVAKIFSKYAEQDPYYATSAFCNLRDGLDASSLTRFSAQIPTNNCNSAPTAKYNNNYCNMPSRCNVLYTLLIANSLSAYGAQQMNACHSLGSPIHQRKEASGVNDAGWYIAPQNYEKFLHQIHDTLSTTNTYSLTKGVWSKYGQYNTSDTNYNNLIYGRFARTTDNNVSDKNLYFKVDSAFKANATTCLSSTSKSNCYAVSYSITVVYLDSNADNSNTKWQIFYDNLYPCPNRLNGAPDYSSLPAITVGNTKKWIKKTMNIGCNAWFGNGTAIGKYSDFYIKPSGSAITFATVEISIQKNLQLFTQKFKMSDSNTKKVFANNFSINSNLLSIFPNPAKNSFTITLLDNKKINEVKIYSVSGKLIFKKQVLNTIIKIQRNEIRNINGVYFIEVIDKNGNIFHSKVIIA